VQDSLQSSGTQGICYRIHTSQGTSSPSRRTSQYEVLAPDKQDAGRGPQHAKKNTLTIRGPSSLHEELPHTSRPFFTPRKLPHYSRPYFTPERLPVCTRPLIHEQSACKTPHVTTDIRKTVLTAKEQQHQSSSSSNCLCKHKHVAQSKSHF
jgi:hypothetical protein